MPQASRPTVLPVEESDDLAWTYRRCLADEAIDPTGVGNGTAALQRLRSSRQAAGPERDLTRGRFHGFIGASPPMRAVYRTIAAAAPSKATVFITGESGTGKEICARAIHDYSPRRDKPFVPLNCAAIPRGLTESELFGHAKGAFTGAVQKRIGAAKLADGGTLFLDEVCEMETALQTKVLRFIQTGLVQPVGSDASETVDVRLVCATNKDPRAEVRAGRLREDLYYRLHVIPVPLPPLRERGSDVLAIARHLLPAFAKEEGKAFKAFDADVEAVLAAYAWPGNVRELQNTVRNIVVLHDGEVVDRPMLPATLNTAGPAAPFDPPAGPALPPSRPSGIRPLRECERALIEDAIARCGGSIALAAKLLQISPSTIYRKRSAWQHAAGA